MRAFAFQTSGLTDTRAAVRSVARALSGFLWLDLAGPEGGTVANLFPFLLRRRSARGIGAVTGGVHPPAETEGTDF